MLELFIVSAVLLFIGILLFGIRIFFVKGGVFPNIHIGGNEGLKKKGIGCATSQDRDEFTKKNIANQMVNDMLEKF